MDVNQLRYFIAIVESGCNLSLAAKKIHISQSALSQMITNFEKIEEIQLFIRKNGRLEELTASGQKLYDYALNILDMHEEMMAMVQTESAKQKGTIRVGIPSLILRVFFTELFASFIFEHPDIKIEIVEEGTHELRRMFLQNDLDYVVLIEPTNLDPKAYEEYVIQIDEMTAFMSAQHRLSDKDKLKWNDLEKENIVTFTDSFMTHTLIKDVLEKYNLDTSIVVKSASWDFLIETTQKSNTIAILPSPITRFLSKDKYVEKHFVHPIPFNILLCRPIKAVYSTTETILHESILEYFYQPIS